MGTKTAAFDLPARSANFDRLARRQSNDYLVISAVVHKALIAVDEHGSEAAAATAVAMVTASAMEETPEPPKSIEMEVDRPLICAIQPVPSGACLFIGRVTDPR